MKRFDKILIISKNITYPCKSVKLHKLSRKEQLLFHSFVHSADLICNKMSSQSKLQWIYLFIYLCMCVCVK